MRIPAGAREYAKTTPNPPTAEDQEISFDGGVTWHTLTPGTVDGAGTWSADPGGTTHAILLASPTATSNPVGTLVLTVGRHLATARPVDTTTEILPRPAGVVDVR